VIVEIDLTGPAARAELLEPGDFKGFKAVLRGGGPSPGDRLGALGVRHDEHVWIPVELLRSLAGDAADQAWEESLAGMLEFAGSRGWVDAETGAIRAHVERPD
jgi:hypothetical protein